MRRSLMICFTLFTVAPAVGYDGAEQDFSACMHGHGKLSNADVVSACTRLIDNAAAENEVVGYFHAFRAIANDDKSSNCHDARKATKLLDNRNLDEQLATLIKTNCPGGAP